MSDSKKPYLRFSLGGLLIVMAAVAMVTAFVSKASPVVEKLVSTGDFGVVLAITLLLTLVLLPLAFILAVRIGMFGWKGRKPPSEGENSRAPDGSPD